MDEWTAAASAPGFSEGTSEASPSPTTSGTPPTAVATTGTPAAIASNSTIGVPSVRELRTKTSKARIRRPAPGTAPGHTTRAATPSRSALRAQRRLLRAVAHQHGGDGRLGQQRQGAQQDVGPLLAREPPHPSDHRSVGRSAEGGARLGRGTGNRPARPRRWVRSAGARAARPRPPAGLPADGIRRPPRRIVGRPSAAATRRDGSSSRRR